MATRPSRYRSSTSASNPPVVSKAAEVLQTLLDQLAQAASPSTSGGSGYPEIRNVVRAFSGFYDPCVRTPAERAALFELLHVVLAVLSATFREHHGNRRYFRHRVEGGGWEALEQVLASIGLGGSDADLWTNCQLFGKLLSFSLDDQRLDDLCRWVGSAAAGKETATTTDGGSAAATLREKKDGVQGEGSGGEPPPSLETIKQKLEGIVGVKTILHNPEIMRAVIDFWESIPRDKGPETNPASVLVLSTISSVVNTSFFNLSALHSTGVLSRLLRIYFDPQSKLSPDEKEIILPLCRMLMSLGVNKLADAQFLLASRDPAASEFCLEMTEKHNNPSFVQFDLSLHGHSSIELPNLGRSFPPQSSPGYTFTAWVRIDRFDPNSHTTIFGVFDATQTCFLLAYLERDTHNFILQTSVTSQRPSVRFKGFTFKTGQWYHIGLVHKRPKTMVASKASLYVNGEFVEQIRAAYPVPPPLSNGSTESFASFTSNANKTVPVQAFLGTPRDLSTQLGSGVIFSRWSMASAHLFEDTLSDDFLAVHYRLGARYQGNFQDCLGSFQTYEASAALGLRNEVFHPGKDENSDILRAIRGRASTILPETKIAMGTMPAAMFRTDGLFLDSRLFRSLSRVAAGNMLSMTTKSGTAIAVNVALPCVNDALVRAHGVSVLSGDPVLAVPRNFDDSLWRLAGFTPVVLKLVERSTTPEELLRAVEMMFLCITKSWRNSDAMERENGYAILAMLLRAKLGYGASSPAGGTGSGSDNGGWRLKMTVEERDRTSFQLLSLVLAFVGYKHTDPIESFIINPLAYRILLIDFDTWRKSAPITQELYYKQFVTFAVMSKYHQFNSRGLSRMRIIKRLLDAMKAENMPEETLPHFIKAFDSLVRCNCSLEVNRALARFVTYALHPTASSLPRTPKAPANLSRSSTPGLTTLARRPTVEINGSGSAPSAPRTLSRKQLGVKILEVYTRLLCERGNMADIRRFARAVTNKWLLCLLAEDNAEIVVYACKILARLLVTHGSSYTSKFSATNKTGGFWVMAHRLKQWWELSTLWPICFCILFGKDVADVDFSRPFDHTTLLDMFTGRVIYPDALPIVTSMFQHGLRDVMKHQDDPDSPAGAGVLFKGSPVGVDAPDVKPGPRSMALADELISRQTPRPDKERVDNHAVVLHTVIRFLSSLHARSPDFREFCLSSEYVRLLLSALYPIIVSADPVSPETELNSKDSALTFEGGDVIIRPVPGSGTSAPIVRTSTATLPDRPGAAPVQGSKGTPLRKASSFILLTAQKSPQFPTQARFAQVVSPKKMVATQKVSNAVLDGLLDLVTAVFTEQVLVRKEFPGFGLFLRVPPGFQEHQAYFESYVLRSTISHLESAIQKDLKLLCEPKALTNVGRFTSHMTEAIFEGWFMNGIEPMLDFTGMLLEYLQRHDISTLKSVRLCSQAVATVRHSFLKLVLLRLSEIDDDQLSDAEASSALQRIFYWQTVLLGSLSADDDYMKLVWYQLYSRILDPREQIRLMAASVWRIMLVQKPDESQAILRQCAGPDQRQLTQNFSRLTEVDDGNFVKWVDEHRPSLDSLFFSGMSRPWEEFVAIENQRTAETARSRLSRRREKLRQWHTEGLERENVLVRHEMANGGWAKSIYLDEYLRHQRLLQDQQDDLAFLSSAFAKMDRDLRRPGAAFAEQATIKWKLDRTEGRNRMRLRLLPDYAPRQEGAYQAKQRRNTDSGTAPPTVPNNGDSNTTSTSTTGQPLLTVPTVAIGSSKPITATVSAAKEPPQGAGRGKDFDFSTGSDSVGEADSTKGVGPEDDFELVENPDDPEAEDSFEDKNRKVMRRLEHGDQVQSVYNISRIIGLEACEGILLIGKEALYLMDNVFQRSDGEIINVWQAPSEERDLFSQIITQDKGAADRRTVSKRSEQESRSWRWRDVISISKRRFLFRDVAVEMFFRDGRSYLLTAINPAMRDELHGKLVQKTQHNVGPGSSLASPEDAWRLEALKVFEEAPQTFGSKFGSIFNSSPWTPIMRRWQKGEISNFHYLMLVNTMAGRTFNDLTQYPVFPWVLADYTSDELDLADPATFRDLSKPMGAQTLNRQADFRERYNGLAELDVPPFHYGTHYSSAMVVASYLIRLPPFVDSYLLLQGGHFDHPDRLFYSVAGAWKSASQDNGSDVRELIPEFFCLPEFLSNINGYDFGTRQDGSKVDGVVLPPWAKGDPKVFVTRHREALESPYVTQNLHHWIDLVFGYKQRGEAAVENLNVFHHMSYNGAVDLDNVTDPQERKVITSIIHNFGQTPHQVFPKPHPPRESVHCHIKRLDTSIYALTKLPYPLLESHEKVASLIYAPKLDRLLCASPFRVNLPPHYDKFLEWGYADNSVRFYFSDNRKLAGVSENLHMGQISCVAFADSKTLITAGEDGVVSAHTVQTGGAGKLVELHLRSSLFGHKTAVTTVAVSKALSVLVTVSQDGEALLWDLNRLEFGSGGGEWLENQVIFTGHRRGRVNVWRKVVAAAATTNTHTPGRRGNGAGGGGVWELEFLRRLDHVDPKSETGANVDAAITCITPMPQAVYTGDEDGRVYEWNLIQRER
ncbi:beige/BEACH domain-containing protein [Magnaporthiopsis poae ATCC 64411]|uniref:Beige/BEACH domain-containing protein n=1 Tax=Magnaporthiopsis poae (strain ATCC 64411 / 73-15) TaxID=644358 RepID=A0A0C4DQP2_MAGP6|nr:beige/BEACH domain-containing protein [Magnaporthiopsis poae ATCC 64411]